MPTEFTTPAGLRYPGRVAFVPDSVKARVQQLLDQVASGQGTVAATTAMADLADLLTGLGVHPARAERPSERAMRLTDRPRRVAAGVRVLHECAGEARDPAKHFAVIATGHSGLLHIHPDHCDVRPSPGDRVRMEFRRGPGGAFWYVAAIITDEEEVSA